MMKGKVIAPEHSYRAHTTLLFNFFYQIAAALLSRSALSVSERFTFAS
jgi:hypothetical protein